MLAKLFFRSKSPKQVIEVEDYDHISHFFQESSEKNPLAAEKPMAANHEDGHETIIKIDTPTISIEPEDNSAEDKEDYDSIF